MTRSLDPDLILDPRPLLRGGSPTRALVAQTALSVGVEVVQHVLSERAEAAGFHREMATARARDLARREDLRVLEQLASSEALDADLSRESLELLLELVAERHGLGRVHQVDAGWRDA